MKTKKILLWALLAIFTSSSCKGEELYRNELTDAVKQVIPYKSGQTVSFINNEGQPLDLFVTKDELGWNKYREGGGAKVDYISYQRKTIELETKSKDFKIYVQLFANSHYSNETNTNGELRIETYVQWKHYLQSKIGFYADYDAEGKMLSKSNKIIHESIEINKKIFHDVIELSGTYDGFDGGGGQFASSTQLFYNKTYGILQINIGKENFITLNPAMLEDGTGVKSSAALVEEMPEIQSFLNDSLKNENLDILKSKKATVESVDIQSVDFTVYPNPNDGSFTVKLSGEIVPYTLEILDQAGRLIETIRGKEEIVNINRSHLITGTYVIKITMNGRTAVKNMIVR